MGEMLRVGMVFPEMRLDLASGGLFRLPGDLTTKYKVVLFYRGHW